MTVIPSQATSLDVAHMERELMTLRSTNQSLSAQNAALKASLEEVRRSHQLLSMERDREMERANKLMTICEATSLQLVQGLRQMDEDRRAKLRERQEAQTEKMAADDNDPPPAFLRTKPSGSATFGSGPVRSSDSKLGYAAGGVVQPVEVGGSGFIDAHGEPHQTKPASEVYPSQTASAEADALRRVRSGISGTVRTDIVDHRLPEISPLDHREPGEGSIEQMIRNVVNR